MPVVSLEQSRLASSIVLGLKCKNLNKSDEVKSSAARRADSISCGFSSFIVLWQISSGVCMSLSAWDSRSRPMWL